MFVLIGLPLIDPALGAACDNDVDNYFTGSGCLPVPRPDYGPDCDDADATVNSGAAEIAGDDLDQSCDGSDGIRRRLQETLNSAVGWASTGSVTWSGDVVTISPSSDIAYTTDVDFYKGKPTAVIDRASMTAGNPCFLSVTGYNHNRPAFPATHNVPIGYGVDVYPLTGLPPAPVKITDIKISCGATAGSVGIDWLVLQDGSVDVGSVEQVWPPAEELQTNWLDTEMPGGGASTTLLHSSTWGLWAGSDVGGLAYSSDDGVTWEVKNGDEPAFVYQQDLAVWGVEPLSTTAVFALTGDTDSSGGLHGGLWYTSDGGSTWDQLYTEADDIAVDARLNECNATMARAGGRLLASVDDDVFIASHVAGAASSVWLLQDATDDTYRDLCELPGYAGLPSSDHYVSAMALSLGATSAPSLLVGYKNIDATTPSLYRCELVSDVDATCVDAITCTPIDGSEGLDVRDIEVDPADPDSAYVAHGGRTYASATCSFGDPTVYAWTLDTSDPAADSLLDLDSSGELSQSTDATYHDNSGYGEVVGIGVEPDAAFLYAVLPGKQDGYYSRVPELMRYDLTGSAGWEDMVGRTTSTSDPTGSTDATNRGERELGVDGQSTWMADQVYKAQWAPAYAIDAVFVDASATTNDPMLLADGFGVWEAVNTQNTFGDQDTVIDWTYLLDTNGDATGGLFQLTVPNGIAADPLDGSLYAATSDLGFVNRPGTGGRSEVACNWDYWNAAGADVSAVKTADGLSTAIWVAMNGGSGNSADGIFRSDDAGATWCFQGTASSPGVYLGDVTCKDGSGAWPACDALGVGEQIEGRGNPMSIAAINELAAVATFKSIDGSTDGTIMYTVDGGNTWEPITGPTGWTDCTQNEFFEVNAELTLRFNDYDGDPATSASYAEDADLDGDIDTWAFDVFVTGEANDSTVECGLGRVQWDSSAPTTYSWSQYTTGGVTSGDCRIDALNISGVTMSPWKDRVVVWGSFSSNWGSSGGAPVAGGGVCSIAVNDTTDRTRLLGPATWSYSIEDVIPHPTFTETFLYAPRVDAQLATDTSCCSVPEPAVLENRGNAAGTWTWTQERLDTTGLQGVAGLDLALYMGGSDPQLFYAAHGTGVSETTLTW